MLASRLTRWILAGAFAFCGAAQANSVLIDASDIQPKKDFLVSCDASCQGLIGGPSPAATWSNTDADAYEPSNSSLDTELALLNSLLGLTGTNQITGSQKFDGAGVGFTTAYEYFGIKKGGWIAYFKNTAGGPVAVTFNNADGTSIDNDDDGYSHYSGFGAVVPIPAAVWLFGSALVGMAGIGYRRQAKAA